jgi:PadR family transcriptional regulator PadR
MTIERFLANWMTQLRKGVLELVVMRALKNDDSYGYALVESIKISCGLEITDGTLYAIFVRLKQEGLIEPYWREMEKGPSRKYYRLTELGGRALEQMELSWLETETAIDGARQIGRKT